MDEATVAEAGLLRRLESFQTEEIDIPKGSLVLLVGPPGSGKSTFAERHFPNISIVPTDALRQQITNNPNNLFISDRAFLLAAKLVQSRLAHGETVVLDAMNLDQNSRAQFIQAAKENSSQIIAIVMDTPIDEIVERDASRFKTIGDKTVRRRAEKAQDEIRHLEKDPNIDAFYRVPPALADSIRVTLSEEDQALLDEDIEFARDTRVAEVNLLDYASQGIEKSAEGVREETRIYVDAGSINFLPRNNETVQFLADNILASQVIDLDWTVRRMASEPDDRDVYSFVYSLLRTRKEFNLTTFVTYGETSKKLAEDLQKGKGIDGVELPTDNLKDALLEVRRDAHDDTPLLILGDIHGCLTALKAHQRNVYRENMGKPESEKRRMLFVGDIADRGPFDAEAVIFTTALVRKREAIWIKGNHDVNLETGLAIISQSAHAAIESGSTWEDWLQNFDIGSLSEEVRSRDTRETIQKLLFTHEEGISKPRLKLSSIDKILDILKEAPTYKLYKHLVAVHGSLPRLPGPVPNVHDDEKTRTHGLAERSGPWTGRRSVYELSTLISRDPGIFAVSGHTHKGANINLASGTANLDYDGGSRGKIAAMYWMGEQHGQIAYETEPSMLKLYEQLLQPDLPRGEELIAFLAYIHDLSMVEIKTGQPGTAHEGLTIINYSQITELQGLWEQYPCLRNFRGLIIDKDGNIVAYPFKKTHKASVEIPLDKLDIVPDKVFEKANGSMGICYFLNGEWYIATKFSFNNEDYTKPAQAMLDSLNKDALNPENTYLFEIILSTDPHIVDYKGQNKLILLNATRTATGEELPWEEVAQTAERLGTELVPDMTDQFSGMTIAEIYTYAQTHGNLENMEGLMAQYLDPTTGEKITVKVKAVDYDRKKFVRDKLAWDKIIAAIDWDSFDMSPEKRHSLLSYNSDDPFVIAALETRLAWIKQQFSESVKIIENYALDIFIDAQTIYDNEMTEHGDHNRAINIAMKTAAATLQQRFREDPTMSKEINNPVLSFIRALISKHDDAYSKLQLYVKGQIERIVEEATNRKGKTSFWVIPD